MWSRCWPTRRQLTGEAPASLPHTTTRLSRRNDRGVVTHQALLRDGTPVTVRRLEPADSTVLERFAAGLSFESWRLRFHGVTRTSGEALTGGVGGRPTVAVINGEIVGVATYVPLMEPDRAEMAVAVADDAQGLGLGTVLFEAVTSSSPCSA